MTALVITAAIATTSVVIWGPIIALVTAVVVAVITSRAQIRSVEKSAEANEASVLLTGYNQLVSSLQSQVSDVQKDYNDIRERALKAEAKVDQQALDIEALVKKHDREMALLHAEIASLRTHRERQ